MQTYSTLQAAKMLGITDVALGRYVKVGKIPAPQTVRVGNRNIHVWTETDIERVRKLLPKIANGRKTRYQKLRDKQKKAPARVPVPHKTKAQAGAPRPQHAKTARAGGPGAALPKKRKTKKKK